MCLEVFVASDNSLSLVPFDAASPAFNVSALCARDEPVRGRFSKPYIYSLGAQTGCSCGFSYGPGDLDPNFLSDPDVPQEVKDSERADHAARREAVRQLRKFLDAAAGRSGSIEMFSCWAGGEAAEPMSSRVVMVEHFGGEAFRFVERELLTVLRDGAPVAR